MKFFLAVATLLPALLMANPNAPQYLAGDKERYEATGICEKCDLSNSTLRGKPGSKLAGANLANARFEYGNLELADFTNAVLTSTLFDRMNLSSAKFAGAILDGTNMENADLSGANFTSAHILNVSFEGANLCRAAIDEEQLNHARLSSKTIMPNCTHYSG